MTNQEAFNRVWNHFVVKGNPQSIQGAVCMYRSKTGAKCAAGVLIPDTLYKKGFEGRPIQCLTFSPSPCLP